MQSTPSSEQSALLTFHSEDETRAFAQKIATELGSGDTILLSGGIGAGKSFLTRAIIHHLMRESGFIEDVPSPTFTLVQTYMVGNLEIWHSDLYRLGDVSEVEELGLLDAFETAVCFVEWPDRLGSTIPDNALSIHLTPGENDGDRTLKFTWSDKKWTGVLRQAIGTSV